MLFNRLFSFIAVASLAAPILAAPLPTPGELEIEHGPFELEIECEKHKAEIELEIKPFKLLGLPIPVEVEIEVEIEGKLAKLLCSTLGLDKRDGPSRSMAASVLDAQSKLDELKPKIQEAMVGPLGSIEKKVGTLMWEVHDGVDALNVEINLFVGAGRDVVYGNPSGGAQLTDMELAKIISTYLLHIAQLEDTVQHVSGYKFTSAQLKIRQDLLSMKKTLGTISPEVLSGAANMMSMALSMGHGVMA
ncbi:unnamed protein product [Rhizoctonia solani]|uniref:Uncharacterized protein n=1 Tax=Rhizoctonia solani TaxID=456999 RepID=A0A8H3CP23_9AGAM|nr:unnamed protein product [Rhizoctonia solani]